jgi:hypothetical protein
MPKRTKKPPVKPEKRLEWLHRVEKEGESLTHIAEADSFDIRTVRKHIDLARLEKDVQRARSEVLRDALEHHYRDLLETVRNIENNVSSESQVSLEKGVPLMLGLRQHMPRSPLWENLRKWNRALTEIADLKAVIRDNLDREIKENGRLNDIVSQGANEVIPGVADALVHQVEEWARGREGLKIDLNISFQKTSEGVVIMRYGSHSFGAIKEEQVETIKDVLIDFESGLKDRPEYLEMENLFNRLGRLKTSIWEILNVILLRRIVPGRCKYCPL